MTAIEVIEKHIEEEEKHLEWLNNQKNHRDWETANSYSLDILETLKEILEEIKGLEK